MQRLQGMSKDDAELHHLKGGQLRLPTGHSALPFFTQTGQQIVRVHKNVHDAVDEDRKRRHASSYVFDTQPSKEQGGTVMVDVQIRHLIVFLSQDEKDGFEEFDSFE